MESRRYKLKVAAVAISGYSMASYAITVPSPFLPKQSEIHGQSSIVTGWMLGCEPLVQGIVTPLLGRMTRKIGISNMMKFGLLLCGLSTAAFAILESIPKENAVAFITSGFAFRISTALGNAAIFNSAIALITITFPERRIFILSIASAFGGGTGSVSTSIGGGFFKLGGFRAVFLGSGAIIIMVTVAAFVLLPVQVGEAPGKHLSTKIPYKKILTNQRLIIAMLISSYSALLQSFLDPLLEPELRTKFNLTEDLSGLVFTSQGLTYLLSSPVLGYFIGSGRCFNDLLIILVGLGMSIGSLLLSGPSPLFGIFRRDLWLLLTCISSLGLVDALLYVPAENIFFNTDDLNLDENTDMSLVGGFLAGVWNSVYGFGNFFGMVIAGVLGAQMGWPWTTTSFALSSMGFMLLILIMKLSTSKCCKKAAQSHIHITAKKKLQVVFSTANSSIRMIELASSDFNK